MSKPRKISHIIYTAALKAQGVPSKEALLICPYCGEQQSMDHFKKLGLKDDMILQVFGFTCINNYRTINKSECCFSLANLYVQYIHKVEIVMPNGEVVPRFTPLGLQEVIDNEEKIRKMNY